MKRVFIRLIHLVAMTTVLFAFTACPKRPDRPSPDQTMSGLGPGGSSARFDTSGSGGRSTASFDVEGDTVGGDDIFSDGFSDGLEPRSASDFSGNELRDVLEPIYFEFDRSTLSQTEREKAQEAAAYLRNNPNSRLVVEGHCDWRGTTEYNMGLGDRRASSVKDYLTSLGIDNSR